MRVRRALTPYLDGSGVLMSLHVTLGLIPV